jgi:hypothetical protein
MPQPTKGHRHPGSGKKKGHKSQKTLDKEAAREHVRQRVTADLDPLLDAQLAHAKGLSYLVVRDKTSGKFLRVTEAMARVKLKAGEELVEVWEKDPSVQAFADLLNRALDKPKEQEQAIKITGDAEQIRTLLAGRQRALAMRELLP